MEIALGIPGRTWTHGFGASMLRLVQECERRNVRLHIMQETSADLYMNRNLTLCPTVLKDEKGQPYRAVYPKRLSEWKPFNGTMRPDRIFWIDTDMTFTPGDFFRLVDHDVAFVSGCCMSGPNEVALGYYGSIDGAPYFSNLPRFKLIPGKGYVDSFNLWIKDKLEGGLCPVDHVGLAFVCTKPSVYEALEYPYFKTTTIRLGDQDIQTSEDLGFCWRVREAGVQIYADPKVLIGHQKTIDLVVEP